MPFVSLIEEQLPRIQHTIWSGYDILLPKLWQTSGTRPIFCQENEDLVLFGPVWRTGPPRIRLYLQYVLLLYYWAIDGNSTFWQFTSYICRGHFTSTLNICTTTFKSTGNYYPSPHPNQGNPIHQISQNVTSLAFLEQKNKKQPSVSFNFFWWDSGKSLLTDQQP